METAGIEPAADSVQASGAPQKHIPVMECGRVESNHHSRRRRVYSALSSPMLGIRKERATGRVRTDTAGFTVPGAAVTPRSPRSGDDRTRTGDVSPDKRAL
jgi:hypothetical protein